MILDNLYFNQLIWIYSCYNEILEIIQYPQSGEINILNRIRGKATISNRINGEISKIATIRGRLN